MRLSSAVFVGSALVACHGDPVGAPSSPSDALVESSVASDSTVSFDSLGDDLALDETGISLLDTGPRSETGAIEDIGPFDGGDCGIYAAGPPMVNVGAFCIDSTEVTNAQYNAFLDAKVPPQSDSKLPSYCAFNSTYGLKVNEPDTLQAPRTSVDWCDAFAYCKWAGKRLCGKIGGGGTNAFTDYSNEAKSEWFYACNGGTVDNIYPYGPIFDHTKCNVDDYVADPVRSHPACRGLKAPFDLIYDLSGNAVEWEDSCDTPATGAGDHCLWRGGAYGFPEAIYSPCDNYYDNRTRDNVDAFVGIRCCK